MSLKALDLAGWYPAAPEQRSILDTLNLDAPVVQPRHRLKLRPGFPNRPLPAFKEAHNRLRDVYGDTYTVGEQIEKGAYGAFKVGSQEHRHSTWLMAAKEINMARMNAPEDRARMATVRAEFNAMRGGPLAPYAMVWTMDMLSRTNAYMALRSAYMFMPLAESDVMEVSNALNEPGNRWRERAAASQGIIQEHAIKRVQIADSVIASFARHVLRCATRELQRLHARNMVHADVKPENLFLMRSSEVVLGDYGSASPVDEVDQPSGSWDYASPEQLLGPYDESADIYALGVCVLTILHSNPVQFEPMGSDLVMKSHAHHRRNLMELWRQQELTGVPAPIAPHMRRAWKEVSTAMVGAKACSPELMPLLLTMIAPDPSKRPSAAEVLVAFERDKLPLTDRERGPLVRALLRIKGATRVEVNELLVSLTPVSTPPTSPRQRPATLALTGLW